MPVCPSDYYSLRQWTVWFIAVDRTVCYSGLYSPLPQTVIIFRLKELGWPGETAYSSLCLWYDIKIPKNNDWTLIIHRVFGLFPVLYCPIIFKKWNIIVFIFVNLILMFIFVMSFSVNIVSWNDKSECIKTSFLSRLGRLFPWIIDGCPCLMWCVS